MKVKAYLRVAKGSRGPRLSVSTKPDYRPLDTPTEYLPTVAFAIELDIPEAAFTQASHVIASLTIPEDKIEIVADVVEMEPA